MDWYLGVWKKYAVFSGRARRQEYWMFILINVIVSVIALILDGALSTSVFSPIYDLAVLLPQLAVTFRRLHDTGRSGWNLLWYLLPLIGVIVMLVFLCEEGNKGDNKYGADPKAENPQA